MSFANKKIVIIIPEHYICEANYYLFVRFISLICLLALLKILL